MKKIKLSAIAFEELSRYVKRVFETELIFESSTLAKLIEYHLQQIWEKLHHKSLDIKYKDEKVVRVKFNDAELICFSYLFAAVPCEGYMLTVQDKLISGL